MDKAIMGKDNIKKFLLIVLITATVSACTRQHDPDERDFKVEREGNGVTVTKYVGSKNTVRIPPTIRGRPVTGIGKDAFSNYVKLSEITIPDSVTSIGNYAFAGTNLTDVTIPNGVTSIGQGAFMGCSSLASVNIPKGVTSIEIAAFADCKNLTSVTIPKGVTNIGAWAFSYCTSLASVNIPKGVTSIGVRAFVGCTSLNSVTIPDSVLSLGEGAFEDCVSLTNVIIGNSVTVIEESAFCKCNSLTSVTIPDNVTAIRRWAYVCYNLTSVTFASGSNIADYDFGEYAFPEGGYDDNGNNLKYAYAEGKAGTYTREKGGREWTKL